MLTHGPEPLLAEMRQQLVAIYMPQLPHAHMFRARARARLVPLIVAVAVFANFVAPCASAAGTREGVVHAHPDRESSSGGADTHNSCGGADTHNISTADACSRTGLTCANAYLECELRDEMEEVDVEVLSMSLPAASKGMGAANTEQCESQGALPCLGTYFTCMGACSSAEDVRLQRRLEACS